MKFFSDFFGLSQKFTARSVTCGGLDHVGIIPFSMVGSHPPVIETPWQWPFGKGNTHPPSTTYHHPLVTSPLPQVLASHVHSSIKKVALTRCLLPSWELTYPGYQGSFESMSFLFPRWDMSIPWSFVRFFPPFRSLVFRSTKNPGR